MSRPRRCASGPTRARFPPPGLLARRWSRSCWPTATGASSAATTSTTSRLPSPLRATDRVATPITGARRAQDRARRLHGSWEDDRRSIPLAIGAVDVDEEIEQRLGMSIQDVFAREGEAAFREIEERVTLELLADPRFGGRRSAAARSAPSGSGPRSARQRCLARRGGGRGLGEGADDGPVYGRWRPIPAGSSSSTRGASPLYEEIADVIVPASRSRRIARRARCDRRGAGR